MSLVSPKKVPALILGLMAISVLGLTVSHVGAQPLATSFEADFNGEFWVAGDVGKSVLFIVEENGTGNEQILGPFMYATSLLHNLARIPKGCGPDSSTGVDGFAVLTFGDGQLQLKRISGTSCFYFPLVSNEEQWRIVSGTGPYVGATGKLWRQLDGDVTSGRAVGTLSGFLRLP